MNSAPPLNHYLSAVDDLLRHPDDQPTIGLLHCRKKNRLVTEYALRGSLPTIEEIEAELASDLPPKSPKQE